MARSMIGHVAQQTGASTTTNRFCEAQGILLWRTIHP
jgi:hypothetical protein